MSKKHPLEIEFTSYVDELGKKFAAFPWENEGAYAAWLAQTYFYVKHTTTLICLIGAKFGSQRRDEHYHALEHLTDERGHDRMALEDLQNLGWDLGDLPEFPETALFYQNQYYMIAQEGPYSHLGYSLCLEGVAAKYCPEVAKRLAKKFGKACNAFVDTHGTVDQDHFQHGLESLHKLTEEDAASVRRNLQQSALLYGRILDRAAEFGANQKRRSA